MAKSKKELSGAAEMFSNLTPEVRKEELDLLGFTQKEIDAVEALVADLNTPKEEKEPDESEAKHTTTRKPSAPIVRKGHPRYKQIQMMRHNGEIKDSFTIKEISIEAERAERLNSHANNSLIRYELIEEEAK